MTVTEAMHVASRISYWPAAYASLLTYLRINCANPVYFSETIRQELEPRSEAVLMRQWEHMSQSERLHVAACVIADEVTGIAEAGPLSVIGEPMAAEDQTDAAETPRNYESLSGSPARLLSEIAGAPDAGYCATSSDRPKSRLTSAFCRGAIVCSAITSIAVIVGCLGVDHAASAAGVSAGLMVILFLAGVAAEWKRE